MLHIISFIFALLPFSFLFNSCHSNSLVGEWVYEASENGRPVRLEFTFLKDKTYIENSFVDGKTCLSGDGTYSHEENVVILKPRNQNVIKGKLQKGKLILTMQTGGISTPFQTFDVVLSKK